MTGKRRIGKREVQALGPREIIWDSTVIGFGARRQTGTAIIYVLQYRTTTGRQRFPPEIVSQAVV